MITDKVFFYKTYLKMQMWFCRIYEVLHFFVPRIEC